MAKWHSADGDGGGGVGGNVAAVMVVDFIIPISISCLLFCNSLSLLKMRVLLHF